MKTLVIEESKWLHGDKWKSLLLNNDGKMCCLGFLAKSCGADDKDIFWRACPTRAPNVKWDPGIIDVSGSDSNLCTQMIITNDIDESSENYDSDPDLLAQKKLLLTELFKQIDINLEFVP